MRRKKFLMRVFAVVALPLILAVVCAGAFVVTRGASVSPILATRAVGPDPGAIAVDARAGHVFVANGDDTLSMLDARDGRVLHTVTLNSALATLTVDERRGRLFVVSEALGNDPNGAVTMLDTHTGAILRATDVGQGAGAIALNQGAGRAYVANSRDDTMSTLDLASGRVVRTTFVGFDHATGYYPMAIAVDARAGHVFTANGSDNSVSMFDAAGGRLLRVIHFGKPLLSENWSFGAYPLAVSEAYGRLFVASMTQAGGDVRVIDTRSGAVARTISVRWSPDDVLLDARTDKVFVRGGPGLLLDARTGVVARAFTLGVGVWDPGHKVVVDARTGRVYVLSEASLDSRGAAVGTGRVLTLDGATGQVLRTVPVGLLPKDLALDSLTDRVFVSNANDAEFNRYGYRARAGDGSNTWSWVPQPIRGWLPQASQPRPAPTGPLSGTVSVIDTTR